MGSSSAIFPGATQSELDAIDDLSLPTLAEVRAENRPQPLIAEAPAWTLTAPIRDAYDQSYEDEAQS